MKPRTLIFVGLALLVAYLYAKHRAAASPAPANVNSTGIPLSPDVSSGGVINFGVDTPTGTVY